MSRIIALLLAASFSSACHDDAGTNDAAVLVDAAVVVDGASPIADASLTPDTGVDAAFVPNFGCSADADPASAPATVTITGLVATVDATGQKTPLDNATVAASLSTGGSPVDTTTSSSTGAFTVTVPTGSVPVRVYLRAELKRAL